MEKYGGQPLHASDTEPLEQEMYFALEKPLIEEILQSHREQLPGTPFAMNYIRPTVEGDAEQVGMVIFELKSSVNESMHKSYDVTLFHYKDQSEAVIDDKDSIAYVIRETRDGVRCNTDAMYADGMCIARHRMNAVEHTMLVDELLAVRSWQLADPREHVILNK